VTAFLVVDGDPRARALAAAALRDAGVDVELARSGEDALLRLELAEFEHVLSDSDLPDMTGFELIDELATSGCKAGITLLGRNADVEQAVEAMRLGASDYQRKPSDEASLRQLVGNVAARVLGRGDVHVAAAPGAAALSSDAVEPEHSPFSGIIGDSSVMRDLLRVVATVAATDSTVLVTGETGTGKELVGRALHSASRRRDRCFSALNAAAIPESLLESELFGHRRGAFTGAVANKKGIFENAHQGTVLLDEVAEMPLMMQAKLLRFLQTGEIQPVGADATRRVDVRLVAATNKDLEREVEAGRFREDLYYRLAVIPVHIPPLRERREDIARLTDHFIAKYARSSAKPVRGITPEARQVLEAHPWPGNVRELENAIERGVTLCPGDMITPRELTLRTREVRTTLVTPQLASLENVERTHILQTLEQVGWNRKRAAEILEISTTTLWRRLKDFGVDAPATNVRRAQG